MGRKLNLSHLSEDECEQILGVLQKDYQVRRAEKKRVNVVHQELLKEQSRISLLKENPKFNENSCVICLERFGIFLRRKRQCFKCELNVCPSCCSDITKDGARGYVCTVCSKEKAYRLLSNEWQFRRGKANSKNFGTAKVVRSLYKRFSSSFSDTELDSGYPPSSISSLPPKPRPRLDQVFDLGRDGHPGDDGNDDNDNDDFDDLDYEEEEDEEIAASSPKTATVLSKPIARATSLDTLVVAPAHHDSRPDPLTTLPPRPLSVTPVSTQTQSQAQQEVVLRRARTPDHQGARPRSQDFDVQWGKKKRGKDTHGLFKEALEGAKRSEEFKFRVRFDQLLGDLHIAIEEKTPNGLPNSFASPSYGEVMLTFKEKVKEVVKGFSQRLILAYDSFGPLDNPEQISLQVKQDLSRFIEDLVGETLDLTSDEAVSDLSSLSDDSAVDQHHSFEDLIAQAVVSKLLENHRKEVSGALFGDRNKSSSTLSLSDSTYGTNVVRLVVKDQATETALLNHDGTKHTSSTGVGEDYVDSVDARRKGKFSRHRRRRDSIESLFSNRSELIPDFEDDSDEDEDDDNVSANGYSYDENEEDNRDNNVRRRRRRSGKNLKNSRSLDNVSNSIENNNKSHNNSNDFHSSNNDDVIYAEHVDNRLNAEVGSTDKNDNDDEADEEVADVVKDFEELKEFVRKTQASARPVVEAKLIDELEELEVDEQPLARTVVNHVEKSEDFHTRITVLDRVLHSEPPLPDFSQFENIDFNSHEIDPDLLSMNLAIIPEETEEEMEQEEDEEDDDDESMPGRWRANWIFKGKGVSPYENLGKKKKMLVESDQPFYMTVPPPYEKWAPWRDAEDNSDQSDDDLLNGSDLDKSEDDETPFYPNTSRELARISGSRRRGGQGHQRSSSLGNDDLHDETEEEAGGGTTRDGILFDTDDHIEDIPGPIIEPAKQELKLLTDLVPAENDDPKFVIPPESVTIQEGEPVKFSCQVAGTPPVDVFWYREGDEVEELEDSEDVELSSNGDKHSATLYNINKKMAGQYMSIALSDSGKAIQYLVVTVKDNKQELKKPEFLKGLTDVEVSEFQSVKFRVKVKGYPPPRISWYKDGAFLRSSKACRIEKFGNRDYILTIDYATMDDDAEYTVSARNVAGEAKSSAQVIVEPHSEVAPKKQRAPSLSNLPSTDSESERTQKPLETPLAQTAAAPAFASPASPAARKRQEQQQITQLDHKLSMTQKRVEEEATKMQADAEKLTTINCTLDAVDLRLATLETSLPSLPSLPDHGNRGEEGSGHLGVVKQDRLMTSSMRDILLTSQETLENEKNEFSPTASPSSMISSSSKLTTNIIDQQGTKDQVDSSKSQTVNRTPPSPPSPVSKENILENLSLPEQLEDFPMPGLQSKTPTPGKSTLNLTIQGNRRDPPLDDDLLLQKRRPEKEKFTSQVELKNYLGPSYAPKYNRNETSLDSKTLLSDVSAVTGDQDLSFDSGKDISLSLASSVSSDTSTREVGDELMADIAKQQIVRKGFHARDYEVIKPPETKKWSVTLDPFSPRAEVVNRQSDDKDKLNISTTDLSLLSSQLSSKDDNSGQSSPRQSVDSGIYVHRPKEHPAPVHMVGDTSENEVPESRTEFNMEDGNIDLPSVNRLKAMFSSGSQSANSIPRDDLGDGSFKRVHSITARSVPKKQLEQLRSMNQTSTSSSPSSSSAPHLQVPGTASKSSATLQLATSSSSSPSNSSSSPSSLSKVTVKTLSKQTPRALLPKSPPSSNSVPSPKFAFSGTSPRSPNSVTSTSPTTSSTSRMSPTTSNSKTSPKGKYEVVDPGKEPVLIYPQLEQPHQATNSNKNNSHALTESSAPKRSKAPEPPKDTPRIPPLNSAPSGQPAKPPRAQPRLIVRRASELDDSQETGKGTPRIKSGYISARAAFWERKIVDGSDIDSEDFPDMVEESDSSEKT